MIGDVWEWTVDAISRPIPATRAFPIANTRKCFSARSTKCSAAARGRRVSIATRSTFRNWDLPIRRQILQRLPVRPRCIVEPNVARRRGDAAMVADVQAGLVDRAPGVQLELPPKYFYDLRGSQLFEAITRLPEYYLTRTERLLLATRMPEWMDVLRPGALVELGAGNADKTRTILDAMRAARDEVVYVPVDVSAAFLDETAENLRREYPGLRVEPVVADFASGLRLPHGLPRPILYAFLGSTIGNLEDSEATELLAQLRRGMTRGDRLLLGADLLKDVAVIEAAYNDTRGVTAEFNRNMLRVLNHELGANFDSTAFAHRAFFSERAGRIEMHLGGARGSTGHDSRCRAADGAGRRFHSHRDQQQVHAHPADPDPGRRGAAPRDVGDRRCRRVRTAAGGARGLADAHPAMTVLR